MVIPTGSRRVFHGILHDVYQWQQKLFDGSSATFEMIVRQPSTEVLATVNNKIIILMQEQPGRKVYLSLPGGRVEAGDAALETAQRELLEETGYKASRWTLLDEFSGNQKYYFKESLFLAQNCKKVGSQTLDAGEKIKVTLVSFDDFLQLCRNPRFVAAIPLKFMMYEALLDMKKRGELKKRLKLNI
ncbi:MAG: NUDIX hydrolase [Nanoarchaeota archaeon]|nr:NUDIX hydrolase [Nanoarchaeota archaeon]